MSSANGQALEVTIGGKLFTLSAAWAAPFFVLSIPHDDEPVPMLYHAESWHDARRVVNAWPGSNTILDSQFREPS